MGAGGLEPPQCRHLRILSPLRLPIPPCPRRSHPKFAAVVLRLVMPGFLTADNLLGLGAFVALAGAYLVVVPLALYWWMVKRWYVMGKIEPFIYLRMAGQGDAGS
jgi:NAD(P)H-quinone oxidoreductase subunit L